MPSEITFHQPLQKPLKVVLGDDRSIQAVGQGNVVLKINLSNNKTNRCTVLGVFLVPELAFNPFSVTLASEKGKLTTFSDVKCEIRGVDSWLVATSYRDGNLYYLDHSDLAHQTCSSLESKCQTNYLASKVWALGSWWNAGVAKNKMVNGLQHDWKQDLAFC